MLYNMAKKDFADVIKNIETKRFSWITQVGQRNHKDLYKREAGTSVRKRDLTTETQKRRQKEGRAGWGRKRERKDATWQAVK